MQVEFSSKKFSNFYLDFLLYQIVVITYILYLIIISEVHLSYEKRNILKPWSKKNPEKGKNRENYKENPYKIKKLVVLGTEAEEGGLKRV